MTEKYRVVYRIPSGKKVVDEFTASSPAEAIQMIGHGSLISIERKEWVDISDLFKCMCCGKLSDSDDPCESCKKAWENTR